MSKSLSFVSRTSAVAAAAVLTVAAVLPAVVMLGRADAAQISNRSIQLSNSASGANGVNYRAQFNAATSSTIKGIVIDICGGDSSPLIGTTCSSMTSANFDWNTPVAADILTFTINGVAQTVSDTPTSAQWGVGTVETGRTLYLSSVDGTAVTSGQTVVVEVGNVDNPNDVDAGGTDDVGTFYGRLFTFPNDTGANSPATYDDASTGEANVTDFGGAAMSTTDNLTVTARVQESLTFCIYTNTPQTGCTTATIAAGGLNIPNATTALNSNSVSTASAYFGLATNALNGANVRMWSNNSSNGVLKSGSTRTINPHGGTMDGSGNPVSGVDDACTADSTASNTEQFGMLITESTNVVAAMPYNCSAGNHGWDNDSVAGAGANDATTVGSAYGDTVATTTSAIDFAESQMEFAAKSALTTEAGIYSSTLNYIATGTY